MPRSASAKVTAIFCAGMYDYDSNFVYAPLVDVQRMLNLGDKVSTIEVFLKEGTSLVREKALVTQAHADARDALENLRDLARGIYPPLLADQGLAAALEAQARKAPVPVTVEAGRTMLPVKRPARNSRNAPCSRRPASASLGW